MSESVELQNLINENDFPDDGEYDEEYADEYYEDEYYEESKVGKVFKWILKISLVLVAFGAVFTVGAEAIAAYEYPKIIFNPQSFLKTAESRKVLRKPLSEQAYIDWMNSDGEKVTIKNSEGYDLNGVFLKKYDITNTYIIMFHPHTAGVSDMAKHARFFHDMDCNVLVVESRGHGESQYEINTLGYRERYDVVDWANYISEKDKDSSIFLFGLGSGGSTVLMASSLDMPSNVKGIIADSAYSNLESLFKTNTKDLYNLPSFPTVEFASHFVEKDMGFTLEEVDVVEEVRNSKLPILIIQSGDDEIVPEEQSEELYEACTVEGSDRLYISSASHCAALNTKPKKYGDNINYFILDNLDNKNTP